MTRHRYPEAAKFPVWFRVVVVALLLVIFWGLIYLFVDYATKAEAAESCPLFGAHRGAQWPNPYTEDSSGAMRAAANDAAAYHRESDVWATSDGVGVMNHDKDWDRTMQKGAYVIREHTLAWTMANIHLKDGSRPQTVQSYIDSIARTHKPSYIHVKTNSVVPDVARRLKLAHVQKWTRVIAQSATILGHFHRLAPGYHLEWVVPGSRTPDPAAARQWAGRVMTWGDTPYAPEHVQAYLDAGLDVEIVSNSEQMDAFAGQFPAARVLTSDVGRTQAAMQCA